MLQTIDWRSLVVCARAYYVGMHRAGIRPIERHRWHYTYWQDTRDRPQVWVVGVTPLLSSALSRTVDTHGEPFRRGRYIGRVTPSESAERERQRERQRTFCITISVQPLGVYSWNSKHPTWSSSTSWENASLHSDIHLDYRRTWLSRSGITGFWTLQNGKYTPGWIKAKEVLIDQRAAKGGCECRNQRYSRVLDFYDRSFYEFQRTRLLVSLKIHLI